MVLGTFTLDPSDPDQTLLFIPSRTTVEDCSCGKTKTFGLYVHKERERERRGKGWGGLTGGRERESLRISCNNSRIVSSKHNKCLKETERIRSCCMKCSGWKRKNCHERDELFIINFT